MNQCPPSPWVSHYDGFKSFRKFAEIFANECLSAMSTTPAIKEKKFFIYFKEFSWVHFTFVNWIFACFSFSGLGKPVLEAMSWQRWTIFQLWSWHRRYTREICSDDRGLFFLQTCKLRGKNKDATMRKHQHLWLPGSYAAADSVKLPW